MELKLIEQNFETLGFASWKTNIKSPSLFWRTTALLYFIIFLLCLILWSLQSTG